MVMARCQSTSALSYYWSFLSQEALPVWIRKMGLGPRGCSPDHCSEHLPENRGPPITEGEDTNDQSLFFPGKPGGQQTRKYFW